MNYPVIVRILAMFATSLSMTSVACAGFAALIGEYRQATLFLVSGFSTGIIGATVLFMTDKPARKARVQDALAVVILFWITAPFICGPPFLDYTAGYGVLAPFYESLSNLTTTGHSLIDPAINTLPASLILWRALLHMIGALISITTAVSVFATLNLGGPGIHKNRLFTESDRDFFAGIPAVLRMGAVFLIVTVTIITGLLLSIGATPREALSGAVSAITTGMVDPASHNTGLQYGWLQALFLWCGLVLGTFGLLIIENSGSNLRHTLFADPEIRSWSGVFLLVSALALCAGLPIFQSFGWATSAIATSGMALGDPAALNRLPLALELFPVLIGGSALSAAGGIKLARLVVIYRRATVEFVRLGYHGSIQHFTYKGRQQPEETVMGVWIYLVTYIVACMTGAFIFSLTGSAFKDAISSAIGILSNAGHLISGINTTLLPGTQLCAMLGMILGRLEVIALLPALNPGFWRR